MKQVADLEPKPGMSPTPGHLQRLLEGLRAKPPLAVVISAYQDPRPGRWLTAQLAAHGTAVVPLLVLPATVPEGAGEKELVQWMDGLLRELLQAARR
jgi:zinc/manganese transport system substrate-binding protein